MVDPLLYLAGMGLLLKDNKVKRGRTYFPPGSAFNLSLHFPGGKQSEDGLSGVLALIQAFGTIGGRNSWNGWGSFQGKKPRL